MAKIVKKIEFIYIVLFFIKLYGAKWRVTVIN